MEKLKVKAVWRELTFDGKIVERTKTAEFEWPGLPPDAAIMGVVRSGDFGEWPKPAEYSVGFMRRVFGADEAETRAAATVESEPMLNGNVRYVFYRKFGKDRDETGRSGGFFEIA